MYDLWTRWRLTAPDYYLLRGLLHGGQVEYSLAVSKKKAFASWGEEVTLDSLRRLTRLGYLVDTTDAFLPTTLAEQVVRHYSFVEYPAHHFKVEYVGEGTLRVEACVKCGERFCYNCGGCNTRNNGVCCTCREVAAYSESMTSAEIRKRVAGRGEG